ncbi:hypothetical protein GGI07_000975, partial [Coemansia sp. Benny D115]
MDGARYPNIAPRPLVEPPQQTLPPLQKVARTSSKQSRPKGKERRKPSVKLGPGPPKTTAALTGSSAALAAGMGFSDNAPATTGGMAASTAAPFDNEDALIQELLAGIPPTAWNPTDPLTSEGWFTDAAPSAITHENIFHYIGPHSQQHNTGGAGDRVSSQLVSAAPAPAIPSTQALDLLKLEELLAESSPVLNAGDSGSSSNTANTTAAANTAAHASVVSLAKVSENQHAQTTPDSRIQAAARSKREGRITNRNNGSSSQKANPLSGFAKKHGVGYPAAAAAGGSAVSHIPPALLSSSPPKARQLRANAYSHFSPPKPPTGRAITPAAHTKNRTIVLETATPNNTPQQHQSKQPSKSTGSTAEAPLKTPSKTQLASIQPGVRVTPKSVRWEISQDKLLLRGVRQQRWCNGHTARDPENFTAEDWAVIAQNVVSSGVTRTARQCRRRWAVMLAHVGSAIMDFVDSTPTPQSSTNTTPVAHGALGAPSRQSDMSATGVPEHIRNLKLADLPMSSPPFMPAFARIQESESGNSSSVQVSSPNMTTGDELMLHRSERRASLESVDQEHRWQSPAYCQLLADVVQALTNPQSQAAQVVRKYTVQDNSASRSADAGGAGGLSITSLPEVSLSAVAPVVVSGSILGGFGNDSLGKLIEPRDRATHIIDSKARHDVDMLQHQSTKLNVPAQTTTIPASTLPDPAAPVNGLLTTDLDIGTIDPDWSIYNQFLQSLGGGTLDLGGDWSSIFPSTAATPMVTSTATAVSMASVAAATIPGAATVSEGALGGGIASNGLSNTTHLSAAGLAPQLTGVLTTTPL